MCPSCRVSERAQNPLGSAQNIAFSHAGESGEVGEIVSNFKSVVEGEKKSMR